MNVLAVIPARGGSKGIPRKNIRPVAGRPLITYMIAASMAAKRTTRTVVSTDDAEIGEIARVAGAEVLWRPPELSHDSSPSEHTLLHVVRELEDSEGYNPDIVLLLQCTSPLTLPADIDGTVDAVLREQADCCFTACRFHGFLWHSPARNGVVGVNHDMSTRQMRQQRDPEYLETGAVYAMRTAGFLEARHRFFGRVTIHCVPSERSLEIDELAELELADLLVASRRERSAVELLPKPVAALLLDFDGVLTDNSVITLESGSEAVLTSRGDGLGIQQLRQSGMPVAVISSEANPVVAARCRKLQIECLQNVSDKAREVRAWCEGMNIDAKNVVYVGNDINDVPCMNVVGCGVAVADAHPALLRCARMHLESSGGKGAGREITDLILSALEQNR